MKRYSVLLICASSAFGAGLAACVLHAPHAHAGSGYPKEITAQSFQLIDAAGKCKGAMLTDPNGCPMLMLTDGRGFGILLQIDHKGSRFIRVFDQDNRERARLQMADRLASLAFLTPQGEVSAHLGIMDRVPSLLVGQEATSNCLVKVENGEARLTLKNPMCKGSVDLVAQTKTAQVSVGAIENKSLAALVYDDATLPRTRVGVIQDGEGKWTVP